MAIELSRNALLKSQQQKIELNLIIQFDGVQTLFGAQEIRRFVRIGDPDLEIGDLDLNPNAFIVGSFTLVKDQKTVISSKGTTQTIRQQLQQDKGEGAGIGTFTVSLQDKNQTITALIAPDLTQSPAFDMMGRKARIWRGFKGTAFPEDYNVAFRGVVTDIDPGPTDVKFLVTHPDLKKRTDIYKRIETNLKSVQGLIADGDTTNGSDIISGIANTDVIDEGADVSGVGIPALATVLKTPRSATGATAAGTIQISANATITGVDVAITYDDQIVDGAETNLVLTDVDKILTPIAGPTGGFDSDFENYIRIDDEVIRFTGISGNNLLGVIRGQFLTAGVAHSNDAQANTIYRLKGNMVDIALKLHFSGINGNFSEDNDELASFNVIDSVLNVPNAMFFKFIRVDVEWGLRVGDFVTTTGSAFGANNVTLKPIIGIVSLLDGDYITIGDGVSFVDDENTDAIVSFRSQFDVWPDGMKFHGDEVDVAEFLKLQRLFLSSFDYDFRRDETIDNGKEFLEQQIYAPYSCYSLPRKARSSLGIHAGPIPGQGIKTLDATNIKNPSQIRIKRSFNRFFFNEIAYRFEKDILEDRFLGGHIEVSQESKNRIVNVPNKTLRIDSLGMTKALSAKNNAISSAQRKIKRYQFGAETTPIPVKFATGFVIEIGDIVLLDGKDIKLADTTTGNREFVPRLMECQNKDENIWKGDITVNLVDTNFIGQGRYCLIGQASLIKAGISTTKFTLDPSFNTDEFGQNEFQKWQDFKLPKIKVRNADFSRDEDTIITEINGNQISVSPALTFTPSPEDIMEHQSYDDSTTTTDEVKLVYGFMSDVTFADGQDQYIML